MRPFSSIDPGTLPCVIGCDEVGRGALCGPVVAAAVWFDPLRIPASLLSQLDDSKRLSRVKRQKVAQEITRVSVVSIRASSAQLIDKIGIREATLDAMRRALCALKHEAPIIVDGIDIPSGLPHPAQSIVRADATIPQVAAASIIAKVTRDDLMSRLGARYPQYGWESNSGYGSSKHLEAIRLVGVTKHHRRSFAPVRNRI